MWDENGLEYMVGPNDSSKSSTYFVFQTRDQNLFERNIANSTPYQFSKSYFHSYSLL